MAPQADRLGHVGAADREPVLRREVPELAGVPAHADAGHDPATGQGVERRELLREDDRVPLGHDDHARSQAQRRMPPADPGERFDRVVVDPVVGGVVAPIDEDVVGRPDRVPAQSLGDLGGGLDGIGRGDVREVGEGESVAHPPIVAAGRH
jgi:hypothetical protein